MYQKSILNIGKILLPILMIWMLNLTGCTNEKTDTISETYSVATVITTENKPEVVIANVEADTEKYDIGNKEILKILENKEKYFNTEFKEYQYLKDYSSGNYMYWNHDGKYEYLSDSNSGNFKVEAWCEVDMDSDGNKEVILQSDNGLQLVLCSKDDIVYSYVFSFRGMKSIKTDGSFEGSSSAANTYIGKLKFVDGECFYDEMCADDELDEENPIYRINKKNVSREEVKSFLNEQQEKEDVLWVKGNPISK